MRRLREPRHAIRQIHANLANLSKGRLPQVLLNTSTVAHQDPMRVIAASVDRMRLSQTSAGDTSCLSWLITLLQLAPPQSRPQIKFTASTKPDPRRGIRGERTANGQG
jgi:hypothetical protein